MQLRRKIVALASSAILVGAVAIATVPAADAAAPPPIDVSNHTVTCNDIIGKIKFSVPLTLGGVTPNQVTLSVKSDECVDNTNGSVSLKGMSGKGILNATNNNCTGLQGLSTGTTGTVTMKWSVNAGTPKITNGGTPGSSSFTINQSWGGTFNDGGVTSPSAASDSWGAQYGFFAVGATGSGLPKGSSQLNTTAPSVSGAFTGGNGGATSIFQAATTQSTGALAIACFTTGIKGITFSIGGLTLQ